MRQRSRRNPIGFSRRQIIGGMAAASLAPLLPVPVAHAASELSPLATNLAEMLLVGFRGNASTDPQAKALASWVASGRVGGVFFVKENVGQRKDAARLIKLFKDAATDATLTEPLIAIDHEGGSVQRLVKRHGFTKLATANQVATTMTVEAAAALYASSAQEFAALGFTMNLAPSVDLHLPGNPVIGRWGRSFGADPATVVAYAGAFVAAFQAAGVACVLKHFPGHGRSLADSHKSLPDITKTWSEAELEPFAGMIANGHAPSIMGGHLLLEGSMPTTLSASTMTGLLRGKLGYQGVSMTDDIDMAAVRAVASRRGAVIAAIEAGNDIIMIANLSNHNSKLPMDIEAWVTEAIAEGRLTEAGIAASAARVRALKQTIA